MRRPAHGYADEISGRPSRAARGVMREAKNTPTVALTVVETMRLLFLLVAATLSALPFPAAVACEGEACTEATPTATSGSVPPSAQAPAAVQIAQLPGQVVPATLSEGRPAGALVMRPETVRAGARPSPGEQVRSEPPPASGSEPSSVWLMLFAGFAFAGFVVAKRSRG